MWRYPEASATSSCSISASKSSQPYPGQVWVWYFLEEYFRTLTARDSTTLYSPEPHPHPMSQETYGFPGPPMLGGVARDPPQKTHVSPRTFWRYMVRWDSLGTEVEYWLLSDLQSRASSATRPPTVDQEFKIGSKFDLADMLAFLWAYSIWFSLPD